jgi:hypothetical protein
MVDDHIVAALTGEESKPFLLKDLDVTAPLEN